jgi:hypothetical protein
MIGDWGESESSNLKSDHWRLVIVDCRLMIRDWRLPVDD